MCRALVLSLAALLAGCGSTHGKTPVTDPQIQRFVQDYQARLAGDSEFTGLLTGVEARRQGSYSPLAVVRLDGRQWAPLVHGQKDRLLRKASVLLVEACRPYQAGHGSACMARFVDDLGTIVGWSVAGGTNPEQYQYQITGP